MATSSTTKTVLAVGAVALLGYGVYRVAQTDEQLPPRQAFFKAARLLGDAKSRMEAGVRAGQVTEEELRRIDETMAKATGYLRSVEQWIGEQDKERMPSRAVKAWRSMTGLVRQQAQRVRDMLRFRAPLEREDAESFVSSIESALGYETKASMLLPAR